MPGRTSNRYLLLYGSQTGQAKAIAEEICERSSQHGLQADLHCLSMTDKKFSLEKETCVVIVTSTTGDGEPPETAAKFVRRIKKKTLPDDYMAHLNYTLLGLGDTNYTNFCNNSKVVDRRLQELGAQHFYPSGFADEAVGLEVVVDPWIEGLYPALQKFLGVDPTASPTPETVPAPSPDTDCGSPDSGVSMTRSDTSVSGAESDSSTSKVLPTSSDAQQRLSVSMDGRTKELNGVSLVEQIVAQSKVVQNGNNADKRTGSDEERTGGKSSHLIEGLNRPATNGLSANVGSALTNASICIDGGAPSLRVSVPPLSEGGLTLPALTPAFLAITYLPPDDELGAKLSSLSWQNNCKIPSAASDITKARVVSAQRLTSEDAVKKTLLLRLNIEGCGLQYRPGDSISVICSNYDEEVSQLVTRLGLEAKADLPIELSVLSDTKKKRATVPPHFPEDVASLRHILKTCLDIREPPKKALLRVLVEFTSDAGEKRRLQELCSKEGAGDHSAFVRGENVSLLDVLYTFPSCQPPMERILEHLSRLQPRPYSACSCPEWNPGHVDIAFNVVDVPASGGRVYPRGGVCTGWLDNITQTMQTEKTGDGDLGNLPEQMQCVTLSNVEVPVCARANQNFRLPTDLSTPILMIGPGTGVAPFRGFLQERQLRKKEMSDPESYGETWLLFGCRNRDKDYLFRAELEEFQGSGTLTQFLPAFSRDGIESKAKYVQDNIRAHASDIFRLMDEKDAVIYVCGDATNMAKDVNAALEEVLQKEKGLSPDEAKTYMMSLRIRRKYLEDVWT